MNIYLDIETSGLPSQDPNVFISCIGAMTDEGVHQFAGVNEKEILREFLEYIARQQAIALNRKEPVLLVTYNGTTFDLPLLRDQMKKHKELMDFAHSFEMLPHLDLMTVSRKYLMNYGKEPDANTRFISKDQACSKVGIYVPNTIPGGECAEIAKSYKFMKEKAPTSTGEHFDRRMEYVTTEYYQIIAHNAIDLYATAALYYKCKWRGWLT